jgi:hypothetical protein
MFRCLILVVLLSASLMGCDDQPEPPVAPTTISSRTFAQVFGELVVARIETLPDTAAYRSRRSAILADFEVSADDLERFATTHGSDVDFMAELYRQVRARVDSLSVIRPDSVQRASQFPRPPQSQP